MATLTLSDGTRSLDLVGTPPNGIYLTAFDPPLPANENTYAEGADSEGKQRVRTRPPNAEGSGKIRVDRSASNAAAFFADLHNLQDLIAAAHREKGTLAYTPEGGTAVTYDLEAIQISGFPQDHTTTKRSVELDFTFECKPYGRLAPVTLVTGEVITGSIDSFNVSGVTGHVDALGELTITDTESLNADLVEFGYELDGYDSGSPSTTQVTHTQLVISGYAGVADYGNGQIVATLVTSPMILCSTGALPHVGRKRIGVRILDSSGTPTGMLVRLKWRVGDGPLRTERWHELRGLGPWCEIDLAVIDIPEVPSGTHSWEGFLEVKAAELGQSVAVNFMDIMPAEVWGRARGIQSSSESAEVVVYDGFNQVVTGGSDPLGGVVAAFGGTWDTTEASTDAVDFVIEDTGHTVQRSELSDASEAGRVALIGSAVAASSAQIDTKFTEYTTLQFQGVVLRYTDINNFLLGCIRPMAPGLPNGKLYVIKVVAGTWSTLKNTPAGNSYLSLRNTWYTLKLTADTGGNYALYLSIGGGAPIDYYTLSGNDSVLATSGTLDDGRVGFYDEYQSGAVSSTRNYDNFVAQDLASVSTISSRALHSGQSMKFLHNTCIRENSAGTNYGRVPKFDGQHLRIPPSTSSSKVGRMVIKRRLYDTASGQPSDGLDDDMTANLTVTPRVLLIGP